MLGAAREPRKAGNLQERLASAHPTQPAAAVAAATFAAAAGGGGLRLLAGLGSRVTSTRWGCAPWRTARAGRGPVVAKLTGLRGAQGRSERLTHRLIDGAAPEDAGGAWARAGRERAEGEASPGEAHWDGESQVRRRA